MDANATYTGQSWEERPRRERGRKRARKSTRNDPTHPGRAHCTWLLASQPRPARPQTAVLLKASPVITNDTVRAHSHVAVLVVFCLPPCQWCSYMSHCPGVAWPLSWLLTPLLSMLILPCKTTPAPSLVPLILQSLFPDKVSVLRSRLCICTFRFIQTL